MNNIATLIKETFSAAAARRPVSHAAAAAIVTTSAYAVHEGAAAALPAGLAGAATAALLGFEWLQWTALGRLRAIEDARDDRRATMLKAQSVGIGALQVVGYAFAVVALAAKSGQDWSSWPAICGVTIGAVIYAALNFGAKYASCDPIDIRTASPTGGRRQPIHTAVFSAPALPDHSNDDNVVVFDLEKAIRDKLAAVEAREAAALALAPPERPAAERLLLTARRLRTRARRAAKRAA